MTLPELEDRPVTVSVAGRTDPGRQRSQNQDTLLVADLGAGPGSAPLIMAPGSEDLPGGSVRELTLGPRGFLLMVADGMGGAAAGGVASALAARTIHRSVVDAWTGDRDGTPVRFASRLAEGVEAANALVHERATDQSELSGMGTTATVAGVLDGFVYIAQVGDSRAYLIRGGAAHQLTRDQSVVQSLVDAGRLTEAEAATSDRRHMILQAVGNEPEVQVELTYQALRKDDVLLLCSDGLSGPVPVESMVRAVDEHPDPYELCERLVALANEAGGPDNVTAVVALFGGPGLAPPADGDRVGRQVFELPGSD
jgi:serine/threonine protein phosphatase PrpC